MLDIKKNSGRCKANFTNGDKPMHENKLMVRYVAEMAGTLVLYTLVLIVSINAGRHMSAGISRALVEASPMIPVLLMMWVVLRYFRKADEYLRLRILENWAITGAITFAWTFAYGFLENAGFPRLSMFVICPAMGIVCAFVSFVRRWMTYR